MKTIFFSTILFFYTIFANAQNPSTQDSSSRITEDYKDDWADLRHYQSQNRILPPATTAENRVVFLGSSIFEFWGTRMPNFFSNKSYINRGISGQISPQLLIRFRQDVIDLKPKAVIILAGSNDIAGSTGHVTIESIMNNIKSMVELAKMNGIKAILCEYIPVNEYPWRKGLNPAEKIKALNQAIKSYATEKNLVVIDYFTPLVDERDGQKANLTLDGVHPNEAGYRIMAKVTEEAIRKALK